MSQLIGYARVSSNDQDLTIQKSALQKAGCNIILEEKMSGTNRDDREKLDLALKILSRGDALVVTRLDRLGRSLRDLANIAHELQEKAAALRVLEQSVDTSSSAGRAFFNMLATFAQFETDIRRERQLEGIAKIKGDPELRRKKYRGRAPLPDAIKEKVRDLAGQERGPVWIARELRISRHSVHRILKEGNREKRQ